MANAEETRRYKARNLRYKKPIAKDLNLDGIKEALWDISEACYDVQYYVDGDEETLLNALDGDEDDAYHFQISCVFIPQNIQSGFYAVISVLQSYVCLINPKANLHCLD